MCRWRMRFMSGMREIDVGSKGDRHFPGGKPVDNRYEN
jgi:hypothetical protein